MTHDVTSALTRIRSYRKETSSNELDNLMRHVSDFFKVLQI